MHRRPPVKFPARFSHDPSLGSVTAAKAAATPHEPFLIGPDDRILTYSEFMNRVQRMAGALEAWEVNAGDRVVLIAENSFEFFTAMYATWWLGACFVPLNPSQHESALLESIENVGAACVIVDGPPESLRSRRRTADLNALGVASAPNTSPVPKWMSHDQAASIYMSSGTTGVSKACEMSNEYLVWSGEEFCRAAELSAQDRVHSLGPFYHVNALWAFAGSVINGTPHAFETRFSASKFWERMTATRATVFDYVGTIISILLRTPTPEVRVATVRAGMGGGARPQEIQQFEERFGFPLLECYGLTECMLPIFQRSGECRAGSIGRLSEYFQARLIREDGGFGQAGETGELQLLPLDARCMFSGYSNNPEANERAFDGEWFKTGDRMTLDEDGYFYYVDRASQVIRRRGENISAFSLEGVLLSHPSVGKCAAIGVPAELGDDDVMVVVQPREGLEIDPVELLAWMGQRVAKFMVPRYVRVMTDLPMTGSERVERHKLRTQGVTHDVFDGQSRG